MTLYQQLVAAKVEKVSGQNSDLLMPVTNETTAILLQHPQHFKNATRFHDHTDNGRLCYDVPFAYDPWWEDKAREQQRKSVESHPRQAIEWNPPKA